MAPVNVEILEATHAYVLLTDKYRISRNIRAQWYLENLNKTIEFEPQTSTDCFDNEIDIISILPSCLNDDNTQRSVQYNTSSNTKFTFFSRKYCFVYVIDLSTSIANVDIQHSSVLTDEIYFVLSKCLQSIVQSFHMPGSNLLFEPELFITILVYIPFFSNDTNNVIVHGYKLCSHNTDKLVTLVKERLYVFIALLNENIQQNHETQKQQPHRHEVIPDVTLVNMIRFGLLTLNLLPENSHKGIVIVTDGNINFPDANTLELALAQLRLSMISCSFIQIGSPPHPDSSLGFVPYNDFMKFISTATFGAYLSISPDFTCEFEENEYNIFHQAFLGWNFHYGFSSVSVDLRKDDVYSNIWSIENPYFYSSQDDNYSNVYDKKDQHLIRKKQLENKINASLVQILSYRLREGFTIKRVFFKPNDNNVEVLLTLPWRHHVNIEYNISTSFLSDTDLPEDEEHNLTSYEIVVESSYNFLHDVTCTFKKSFKSPYRSTTIKQFWGALKNFSDSDKLGIHFHNFAKNDAYRIIPESIKNGVPLFYLPPSCNTPVISFTNDAHLKFSQYWKPICMLDVNMCQKSSLHTHQINILLKHDTPLPEFLYQPNQSGRYDNIQCQQAMSVLNVMLKEWSSFVLLENHSYIKLIDMSENNPSCSFYLIRIISQPPCIVLHLAFIGGTSGSLRNQIVNELTSKLKSCKLPQRNLSSSLVQKSIQDHEELIKNEFSEFLFKDENSEKEKGDVDHRGDDEDEQQLSTETADQDNANNNKNCFIFLIRPIERMLIRYEKIPLDFFTCYKYEEDLKLQNNSSSSSLNMFQTLTRYLSHKRFIWSIPNCPYTHPLSLSPVSKILSVLTMKRIQEGFYLAYNDCGIVNLVMELTMKDEIDVEFPCLVQYIIFPSNIVSGKNSVIIDEFDEETGNENGDHLIVTECWVEPQNGHVINKTTSCWQNFLVGLNYDQISLAFYNSDSEIINTLLTYEHLVSYASFEPECKSFSDDLYRPSCSSKNSFSLADNVHQSIHQTNDSFNRFNLWRYNFDLLSLLPKSQQARIKFIMMFQSFNVTPKLDSNRETDSAVHLNNCINMMLYSEFLLKLINMHDKELEFSQVDSIGFLKQANQSSQSYDNSMLFENVDTMLALDESIIFKCFCKKISPGCIILTIVPSSYEVVRKLSFINDANIKNENLISKLEEEDSRPYGSLVLPVFCYKLTFQSLTNILLDNGANCTDNNGFLFFDYSDAGHEFDFDPNKKTKNIPLADEIALEHFCHSIEILYWNSFTDAVYKSLRYGFVVDQRDIKLVVDKICLKTFDRVEITKFLIYTCKHLNPLIAAYFEKFPGHNIFDLFNYLMRYEDCDDIDQLKSFFNVPLNVTENCDPSNDNLKSNFTGVIQTHFTPIPTLSNNYYFYDYENIQIKKFSLGAVDVETNKLNLLKFYEDIENNNKNVAKFYEVVKKSSKILLDQEMRENINDDFNKAIKDEIDLSDEESDNDYLSLMLTKPFFVGFSYSLAIQTGNHFRTCKTTSIPTCLFEFLSQLSDINQKDIQFNNFRVFLTVEIITQNLESPLLPTKKVSTISNAFQADHKNIESFLKSTLDEFQVYKYFEFVNRIEWLIIDEIVSLSHNLFLVCPTTLQMVVEHIKTTGKSNTSFIDKVTLGFISNDDECFARFRFLLSDLSFSNYKLCELGDYYYVVHQSVSECNSQEDPSQSNLLFSSNQVDLLGNSSRLIFNEEFFDDLNKDTSVVEYAIEENSSNLSPNFWLILIFENDQPSDEANLHQISLYFHSRQNIYVYGFEIFNQLKKSVELLCKRINQQLLLERLDQTRVCDELLISAEDRDPYIIKIRSTLNSTPISQLFVDFNIESDLELNEDKNLKLNKTNFLPSAFVCDIVWNKHFSLHPRLNSKNVKDGISAMKSVLNSFTVSNRNNLYVYKETGGSVFYLRVYEIECAKHLFSENYNNSNSDSLSIASSQVEVNNCYFDNLISSNDIIYNNTGNVESTKIESDKDTDSIASFNYVKTNERLFNQQCILLNVHGLTQPSKDIKEDMVGALQKKLDEAVLDMLVLMLSRNPLSKFTYEDVCFIQSKNSLFENFYFVINENYFPYISNIKAYIRQNLSNFMFNPKYADSNSESHFKYFKNDEFHCIKDDDVFILNCQQESGKDSKGIACVILSIVSKEKVSSNSISNFVISQNDINDFISGNFEYITSCYSHEKESANIKFYINFQVWISGKIDINFLHKKLMDKIRNSLWDFNLEFKIFKLCSFDDHKNCFNSLSEPSTPKKINDKKERRSGLSTITGLKQNLASIEDNKFCSSPHLVDYSKRSISHDPELIDNSITGGRNYFDFSDIDIDSENDHSNGQLRNHLQEVKNKDLHCLAHLLNIVIKPWLDFGNESHVPSLKKYQFSIVLKNSIPTIIKEFNTFIKNYSSNMKIHFLKSAANKYYEFDHNSENLSDNGNLLILLRHENLWNTKDLDGVENSFTQYYHKFKNETTKLHFVPNFTSNRSINDSNFNLNQATADSKNLFELDSLRCIAPRQKFLLLYIEDRYITLYLYNWANCNRIVVFFSYLIIWHNARSLLLQSLILQKAGLFHHLPFKRYSFEDILLLSNIHSKFLVNSTNNSFNTGPAFAKEKSNFNLDIFKNIDLLLKYTNPYEAFEHDFNQNKDSINKADFIFDSKIYSFIFSSFNHGQTAYKNLYEAFNEQFNSNGNNYIKDLKDLSRVWQLHGSKLNYPIMDKITKHVKKYGRLSHYCLTPFLFSHKWRYTVSLIRDHTLSAINNTRLRHLSGGQILKSNNEHEFMINKRSRRKSGPPNIQEYSLKSNRASLDENLDMAVCSHYIQEYVQYLQSLGFSSIKSQKVTTFGMKRSFDLDKKSDKFRSGSSFSRKTSLKNEFEKFYLIKTLPGGFFLFEIGFCEPYVYSYLYSFDSKRFATWAKADAYVSNLNIINFLDELDSIKFRIHLHSFTYDYHLRAIHSYISGRQLFFRRGYHLISFLDDFIRYYQKAPNYARNHVYSDYITYESKGITSDVLYNYITSHNKLYGMEVFRMNPPIWPERACESNNEYVLIQLSSHRIPYIDENNISQEDNFDVGVLVTYQKNKRVTLSKDNVLCLKFFLLLTSQRELFPKLFPCSDSKGSFRTIRLISSVGSNLQSRKNSIMNDSPNESIMSRFSNLNRGFYDNSDLSLFYSGICDEKINYLGYFNAYEIVMLTILEKKVNETKQLLQNIIISAEIDCRRDALWGNLLPSHGLSLESSISLDEFNELLRLVKSIRIDEYDINLAQFNTFNFNWYRSLAQKLELKFEFSHRKFQKDNSVKMAFFKNNCKDCFILYDIKNGIPYVDIKLVFKKPNDCIIDTNFLNNCNSQYHELVEDFVNACTSHMWSVIV